MWVAYSSRHTPNGSGAVWLEPIRQILASNRGAIMLFTSDRKASRAKRAFMVCMFIITFGTVTLTMIVDNAPSQPAEAVREGPLRRLACFLLAVGLLCA